MGFGGAIYRVRWLIVATYVAAAAGLAIWVPALDKTVNEPESFLPASSPYSQAIDAVRRHFPADTGLGDAVIIFERQAASLTSEDRKAVVAAASAIRQALEQTSDGQQPAIKILSPKDTKQPAIPLPNVQQPPNPLVSPDSRACLIVASLPYDFLSNKSAAVVQKIREVLSQQKLPAGLSVAVTGASGFGHDYGQAALTSHEKTLRVTLLAVIIILVIVYRSPIAPIVPLLSISLAGVITLKLLALLLPLGLHVGTAEQIFVFVLLYGAGTDYSLLFISRYREKLDGGRNPASAAITGLNATMPPILASAGTNTLGLLMLVFAQFAIFRTTGPAVAIALLMALAAAVTLTPALVGIIGPRMFWPSRRRRPTAADFSTAISAAASDGGNRSPDGPWLWRKIAGAVVTRPMLVLLVTVAVLAYPAINSFKVTWAYDSLTDIAPASPGGVGNAAAGVAMVKRHWPEGEISPVSFLIETDKPLTLQQWTEISDLLTTRLSAQAAVEDVRSLSQPLGKRFSIPEIPLVRSRILQAAGAKYVSQDSRAARLGVVLGSAPLTLDAMEHVKAIRQAIADSLDAQKLEATVYVSGATAEMIDTRSITQSDFRRVAALALAVILAIIVLLLRDVLLSLFMVASTLLSYLATLGVCGWVFVDMLGLAGLDWKVEVFLFVVMVAVGQDYNIFLASRLAQEARRAPLKQAVRNATIFTGPVISSCGLIMAATLGSLMAGDLGLLKQLGFAFALGMLIDTFIVRPLLLPAFAMLTKRTGKAGGMIH